ncbi:MAG: nucleoside triphosphate pyrophosphohydrolase [Candidatus Niameybacter stercoravium]|nr:nucleoside triphosphate pyrophosphohydrolase [Candidatus Niameybacter stercoravium]
MKDKKYTYQELLEIIAKLRSEEGCAWDREQTHESLKAPLLEESYELVDAINNKDMGNMKEELGDVLLQVLMHAQIASEQGTFTMEDVVDGIASKLVYRHPHVFGTEEKTNDTSKILQNWEMLKKKEKNEQSQTESMMRITKALPALTRAYKVQKKAASVGFMWDSYEPIIDKVLEELEELKIEIKSGNKQNMNAELGDVLFSVVNLSYFLEINPEFALTNTTEKFINRFRYIENSAFAKEKQLTQMTLEEMDQLWQESKKVELNI